jgi:hypothetical protein
MAVARLVEEGAIVNRIAQTSSSIRRVRLFSAPITLDPLAVAPERAGSEATYSPSDSCTLAEYVVPPTVVEKLASCISSAALLLALAPPEACPEALEAGTAVLAELVVAAPVVAWADFAGTAPAGIEAALTGAATGFNTRGAELLDEIALINMAGSPHGRRSA